MIITAHQRRLNLYRFVVDLCAVCLAWCLSFFVRFDAGLIAMPKGDAPFSRYLALVPSLLMVYALVFLSTGFYRRTMARRRIWLEHFDIIRTTSFAFLSFVALTYFLYEHRFSRITLALFLMLSPLLVALGRSVIRKLNRRFLAARSPSRKAIVVGSGKTAARVEQLVRESREWNLELVGCFSAQDSARVREELQRDTIAAVFVAASAAESPHLQDIYNALGNTMAEVLVVPDFGVSTFLTPRVLHLDTLPAVAMNISPLDELGLFQKRAFDICFSLAFITVFSPVFLLCALLVRLSSPGPILYRQERMGLDGRTFWCLKFRGMRVDAEAASGPVWAKSGDDRTTWVGKWLRKSSLDEIPQFFNVLKGDMSIVGPRPERPFFVEQFRHQIPGYMIRHKAKAGITGWAQINGWRGNTSLERRIECDLWYLQNWSLWLDLKICLMTPLKGLVHPNAY